MSNEPSKLTVIKNIFMNFPDEISNFKRIPCAMNSIYTGIIGGTLAATVALVSTGRLSSMKFGVLGYLGCSIASCESYPYIAQLMNRLARKALPTISGEVKSKHRSFKEMIQWRKEREKVERLNRNKKLMDTLKRDINPRFQLADIRAFSLPKPDTENKSEWNDLGLRDDLIRGLVEGLKLKKPLPAQISGIPRLMTLKTGLFAAPTGCGKTLTYLLPLFQNLKRAEQDQHIPPGLRSLILVPTHELVKQVYKTAKALSHYAKLRVETIDTVFKFRNKPLPDILITTPRSLLKNRTEGPIKLKIESVSNIIVDEADTLLSADFASEVKEILASPNLPKSNLQVLATSATITRQLQRTMTRLFPDSKIHMVPGLHAALPTLRQRFVNINQPGNAKMQQTLQLITENPTSKFIVFCNKLVKADALHKFLCDSLGNSVPILPSLFHGHLPPIQRASIMQKFASGDINILICTDLAARGLDTPWVNHVINFDFPRSLQDYLHRAGRTARAGRGGVVTSFITAKDRNLYEYIQLAAKQRRILSDPLN